MSNNTIRRVGHMEVIKSILYISRVHRGHNFLSNAENQDPITATLERWVRITDNLNTESTDSKTCVRLRTCGMLYLAICIVPSTKWYTVFRSIQDSELYLNFNFPQVYCHSTIRYQYYFRYRCSRRYSITDSDQANSPFTTSRKIPALNKTHGKLVSH